MKPDLEEKKKKEAYEKPTIESEAVEMGAYGASSPVPESEPFFGLCPPCGAGGSSVSDSGE